jgi:hypothetical protein
MTSSTLRWFIRLVAAVALWPASAEAQTMARSFEELMGIVKTEETVIFIDTRGRRVKGVLTEVDKDSISLATDGRTQTFTRSEVSTVRIADGLANGAVIGAAAGLGAALGILAIAGSGNGYVLPSAKVGAPLLLSGIGALMGALIDRAHDGGRVLYVSPGQTSRLIVCPVVGQFDALRSCRIASRAAK